jgi:hypothetical protein
MSPEEFRNKQLYISMGAGTSQRVHQDLADRWTRWDRIAKATMAAIAVVGLWISLESTKPEWAWLASYSTTLSVVGLIAAIALNLLPFGDWAMRHISLYQRWCDMREDVDSLQYDIKKGEPSASLVKRLKELDAKYHRICASEPKCGEQLVLRHYDKEKSSRRQVAVG